MSSAAQPAFQPLTFEDLKKAVSGNAAAFRCRRRLQPGGGEGDKVFPPTYAGGVYAVENRLINDHVVRCVLLDSIQSQANRMEEALLDAILPEWRELPGEKQGCELPVIAVHLGKHGWVTSLTAPHRIHDAILRDSNLNGTRFRDSDIGKEVVAARVHNATAFYRWCPTALLFGTWDSNAGEGLESAKIPRAVVSEIIGVDITAGVRTASRLDPLGIKAQSGTIYRRTDGGWALKEKDSDDGYIGATSDDLEKDSDGNPKKFGKGKPSDINHGNITPDMPRFERDEIRKQNLDRLADILQTSPLKLRFDLDSGDGRLQSHTEFNGEMIRIRDGAVKPGGVTLAYALHTWLLSLTQLRRLRFPVDGKAAEERNTAARTVLAALAVYVFALQNERGYWLRSRCELIPELPNNSVLQQLNVDTDPTDFKLPSASDAKKLLTESLKYAEHETSANIQWAKKVIRLTPSEQLKKLVEFSDSRQTDESAAESSMADVGDQN